jgi:hypothetical protein
MMLRFEVLTGVDNEDVVFRDVMPCNLVDIRVRLKREAVTSSETSVNVYQITQHLILRYCNLSKIVVLQLL